ncbi:hypothetical protein C8Q78DRAFT_1079910 [Trametes maxima]|nr:hypothetical protein C8Q78DRAFT_1079910 [Trametes maxima]
MYWLSIFRIAVLAWSSFCAIILLGLGAHFLASADTLRIPTAAWSGLAVATAVLSLITMPTMVIIDILRTGAFTSLIVVELAWLGFLGILFLATGAAAAQNAAGFWVECSTWTPALARNICGETSAGAAFGFLGWLPLWAYAATLLTLLILHANRGHYVWKTSVKEAGFEGGIPPAGGAGGPSPYGTDVKAAYEAASLNPAQAPYAYPPTAQGSPAPPMYGSPAAQPAPLSPYPQV